MSICASLARKFPKATIIGEEVSTSFVSTNNLARCNLQWNILCKVLENHLFAGEKKKKHQESIPFYLSVR